MPNLIQPNKKQRPDFDYNCDCGFYVCDNCGYSMYPMEIEISDDQEYDCCPICHLGEMVKNKLDSKNE